MGKERSRKKLLSEFDGKSPEFQILKKEFVKICKSNNLDLKGMQIVDQIYQEWFGLWGKTEEKAEICKRLASGYSNVLGIQASLLQISIKYAQASATIPVGKYASKVGFS